MDHLLYPPNSQLPHLEIPYLAEADLAHKEAGFLDFAVQQGWCVGDRKWRKFVEDGLTTATFDAVAAYAQAWLYFELLDAFLGEKVDREMFKKPSGSGLAATLTSAELPTLLGGWRDKVLQLAPAKSLRPSRGPARSSKLADLVDRLDGYLFFAAVEANILDDLPYQDGCQLQLAVAAIKVLIESLRNALQAPRFMLKIPKSTWIVNGASVLRGRLFSAGHCPSRIETLYSTYSTATLYYISGLQHRDQGGKPHNQCTANNCEVLHVDMNTYVTKHSDDCPTPSTDSSDLGCRHIGPEMSQIRAIIESGDIPIVCVTVDQHGELHMAIRPRKQLRSYIAISHVWADGLGNPTANSLRRCQLQRLHDQLRVVPQAPGWSQWVSPDLVRIKVPPRAWKTRNTSSAKGVNFWMDTLCIPPSGQGHDDMRKTAIGTMGQVYAGAESILVLDRELQSIRRQDLEQNEVLAHLSTSAWLTRCWTYQEAVLARRIFFQFKDGQFDILHAYLEALEALDRSRETQRPRGHDQISYDLLHCRP